MCARIYAKRAQAPSKSTSYRNAPVLDDDIHTSATC
nr:MAG TPA_asm: hypothetical protein [Caudoviricetes sp.]